MTLDSASPHIPPPGPPDLSVGRHRPQLSDLVSLHLQQELHGHVAQHVAHVPVGVPLHVAVDLVVETHYDGNPVVTDLSTRGLHSHLQFLVMFESQLGPID